jgi:uncharacterized protein (DUF983 family)
MFGAAGARQSTDDRRSMTEKHIEKGQPAFVRAALFGHCPKCGSKTMFASATQFHAKCTECGLDYGSFNVGDGPAALMIIPIGAIIITLAVLLDIAVRPPFWLHVLIWVPLTMTLVVAFLRFAKGTMLTLEYRNRAGEGQHIDSSEAES